jgi:hypothetical protein
MFRGELFWWRKNKKGKYNLQKKFWGGGRDFFQVRFVQF